MLTVFQLLKLPFINLHSLFLLLKAKIKHGKNLCFLLKFAADYYKTSIALNDGKTEINYKQFYESVLTLSHQLSKQIEITKKSEVILVCNNSIDHILLMFAIQNLGLPIILINDKLHPNEINKIIKKQSEFCIVLASNSSINNAIPIDTIIVDKKSNETLLSKLSAKTIFATSGTTGEPKLIEKKKGEFYWLQSFADIIQQTSIHKRKVVFISPPITHGFGYTALLFTIILGKKGLLGGVNNLDYINDFIINEKTDLLVGVPTGLYKLAEKLAFTNHSVHTIISGGASFNDVIFNKLCSTLTRNIFSLYGSTEASTTFIADYTHLSQNSNALGRPLKGIRYNLNPLPNGSNELSIKSGLSNINSSTGWIATGDIVEKDMNGDIVWCSRKDEMMIKSGVNIYPIEIEKALLKIDGIEEVFITGEKDSLKGEIIVAFIKYNKIRSSNEEDIKVHLRQFLSGIKIPDKIYNVDTFEYTPTGKIIKPGK